MKVTPELDKGAAVLDRALRRLDEVRDEPYLAPAVDSAIDKIHAQLVQAEREARHAAAAAQLAPAIFGADGPRRYLLVVQNNAESRATGGFIGSFGTITAEDGKLTVSEIERTGVWNAALREPDVDRVERDPRLQEPLRPVQAGDEPPERQPHARLPGGGEGAHVARPAGRASDRSTA